MVAANLNRPLACLQALSEVVRSAGLDPMTTSRLDINLETFEDIMGACERILKTPIPLSCEGGCGGGGEGEARLGDALGVREDTQDRRPSHEGGIALFGGGGEWEGKPGWGTRRWWVRPDPRNGHPLVA